MTRRPNHPVAAIYHQGEAISYYCHDPVLTGLQMLATEMADFVLHLQTIDPRPASWPG